MLRYSVAFIRCAPCDLGPNSLPQKRVGGRVMLFRSEICSATAARPHTRHHLLRQSTEHHAIVVILAVTGFRYVNCLMLNQLNDSVAHWGSTHVWSIITLAPLGVERRSCTCAGLRVRINHRFVLAVTSTGGGYWPPSHTRSRLHDERAIFF